MTMEAHGPNRTHPLNPFETLTASGSRKVCEALDRDPTLRALDALWSAHPALRDLPIDWAGAAWALRTVWALSLASPVHSLRSVVEVNVRLWQRALEGCEEVAQAWLAEPEWREVGRPGMADRQGDVLLRLMTDLHGLAADWLLRLGQQEDGMDEELHRRLTRHLGEFVEATRPVLVRLSPPG